MKIRVTKLTDVNLLQKCASFTTGKDCQMSLKRAYASGHSIIRSQIFVIELTAIHLFVASQLVRSHVGIQYFQRSRRTDRGGEDFSEVCNNIAEDVKNLHRTIPEVMDACIENICDDINRLPDNFDRYAPTDLCFIANAEALINMAHKRLCKKASPETRDLVMKIRDYILGVDPQLAQFMVPACVHQGFCREPKSCGYTMQWKVTDPEKQKPTEFQLARNAYLKLFK